MFNVNIRDFVIPYNVNPKNVDVRPASVSYQDQKKYKIDYEEEWTIPQDMIVGKHIEKITVEEFTAEEAQTINGALKELYNYLKVNINSVLILPETDKYKLKVHRIGSLGQFEEIEIQRVRKFFKKKNTIKSYSPLSKESHCQLKTTPQDPIFFTCLKNDETPPEDFFQGQLIGMSIIKLCRGLKALSNSLTEEDISHYLVNLGPELRDGGLPDYGEKPNKKLVELYNTIIFLIVDKLYNSFHHFDYFSYKGEITFGKNSFRLPVKERSYSFVKGRVIQFGDEKEFFKITKSHYDGDKVVFTLDSDLEEKHTQTTEIKIVGFRLHHEDKESESLKRQVPGYECDIRYVELPQSPAGKTTHYSDRIEQINMTKIREVLDPNQGRKTSFAGDRIYFQIMFEINQMLEKKFREKGHKLKILGVYSPFIVVGTTPEIILDKRHIQFEKNVGSQNPQASIFYPPDKSCVSIVKAGAVGGAKKLLGGATTVNRMSSTLTTGIHNLNPNKLPNRGVRFNAAQLRELEEKRSQNRKNELARIKQELEDLKSESDQGEFIQKLQDLQLSYKKLSQNDEDFKRDIQDIQFNNQEVFDNVYNPIDFTGSYIDEIFFGEYSLNAASGSAGLGGGGGARILSKKKKKKNKNRKSKKKKNKNKKSKRQSK